MIPPKGFESHTLLKPSCGQIDVVGKNDPHNLSVDRIGSFKGLGDELSLI